MQFVFEVSQVLQLAEHGSHKFVEELLKVPTGHVAQVFESLQVRHVTLHY